MKTLECDISEAKRRKGFKKEGVFLYVEESGKLNKMRTCIKLSFEMLKTNLLTVSVSGQ